MFLSLLLWLLRSLSRYSSLAYYWPRSWFVFVMVILDQDSVAFGTVNATSKLSALSYLGLFIELPATTDPISKTP
jgi:hypothetical protein